MTPTLEEIARFMGKGYSIRSADLHNKRPIISKNVDAKKFLDLLKDQPNREGEFEKWVCLIGLSIREVLTTMESPTIIPMILVDLFRALTKCENGETYFEGCNILIQI
ncbi:hypothetical protein KY290_008039 [Solanum tuberosum]|uniref:Uncharacterized protein n=1 Tax=Solanum tuberosum TaxID=4113 RepID=A0ABQ7W7C0_SOLTU|nr:hypothetical protein KY290_008039 [Solanum tuberosum]